MKEVAHAAMRIKGMNLPRKHKTRENKYMHTVPFVDALSIKLNVN